MNSPRFGFVIFLGLIFGAVGWALHLALILLAWLNGGPLWAAQGTYNTLREGPIEIGVFAAASLFLLLLCGQWARESAHRRPIARDRDLIEVVNVHTKVQPGQGRQRSIGEFLLTKSR